MSATISLATIRAQYPTPSTVRASLPGDGLEGYCVGGALCLAGLGPHSIRFPTEKHLAQQLIRINPDLAAVPWKAGQFAEAITIANDRGDFEEAWRVAGEALDYGQGKDLEAYYPTLRRLMPEHPALTEYDANRKEQ